MSDNSRNDEFPTIRLDDEDRRDYQKKKQTSSTAQYTASTPSSTVPTTQTKNTGGNGFWIFLVSLIALAGVGASYYLFTLTQQQQALLTDADKRISQLEAKLSATGEEIGESTVALQVKVTELTNKTAELWEQMDKLWASAWRRNQKEIGELGDKLKADKAALEESIGLVARNQDLQKTKTAALEGQLSGLSDELLSLNLQIEQTAALIAERASGDKVVNDKLSLLEQRNNALAGRIGTLEREIKSIATNMVSQETSSTPSSTSNAPANP